MWRRSGYRPPNTCGSRTAAPCSGCSSIRRFNSATPIAPGQIEVEGDLVEFVSAAVQGIGRPGLRLLHREPTRRRLRRPRRNTWRDPATIFTGTMTSATIFALWLGETMAHTCAYYPTAQTTLDQAQVAKMDHVAASCGSPQRIRWWRPGAGGGAWRCTLRPLWRQSSGLQHLQAADRIRPPARPRAGHGEPGRVHRGRLPQHQRHLRAFVSVGMLEHVGPENYPEGLRLNAAPWLRARA